MQKYTVEIIVNGELQRAEKLAPDYIARLLRAFNNIVGEQEIEELYEEE